MVKIHVHNSQPPPPPPPPPPQYTRGGFIEGGGGTKYGYLGLLDILTPLENVCKIRLSNILYYIYVRSHIWRKQSWYNLVQNKHYSHNLAQNKHSWHNYCKNKAYPKKNRIKKKFERKVIQLNQNMSLQTKVPKCLHVRKYLQIRP